MAIMFPDKIECFCKKQPGEILTYIFLRDNLPDNHHVLWNIKPSNSQELDFLIISPDIGLIVLEVKDWNKIDTMELEYRDPKLQGTSYINSVTGKLKKCNELLQSSEVHEGKLKFCYANGVVLPNLCRDELLDNEYYLKDTNKFLLKDDFSNVSSDKLREKLYLMGTGKFTFDILTEYEITLIKDILLDNIKIFDDLIDLG